MRLVEWAEPSSSIVRARAPPLDRGVRANAVALGSIRTERYDDRLDAELRRPHPLGRVGARLGG